ncbi:MAG TPA: ferritin family protein [Devosia sp.]|nr:ferritin family protein [Devosia sp.]
MDQLLAVASAMEQEAIAGYTKLAERMRQEGREELAEVFVRLVAEETEHLNNVVHWAHVLGSGPLDVTAWEPPETFEDEGAGLVAPELLSAYRAFSMAVRNEERAFLFWTYVASQAPSDQLRLAAERMAREELGHVAILRRERRQAFHAQRAQRLAAPQGGEDMIGLERRLAALLERDAAMSLEGPAAEMRNLARQARARADSVKGASFADPPLLRSIAAGAIDRAAPLCELLLECYLDLADNLPDEADRNLAQTLAASAVHCLSALRQ